MHPDWVKVEDQQRLHLDKHTDMFVDFEVMDVSSQRAYHICTGIHS
jgi:hypothetical protein